MPERIARIGNSEGNTVKGMGNPPLLYGQVDLEAWGRRWRRLAEAALLLMKAIGKYL